MALPEGTLFVVIHGLITIVRRQDGFFHCYFVEPKDNVEHEYLAGSWLNELPIVPGDILKLVGVTPGSEVLDGTKNLIVKVKSNLDDLGAGLRRVILPPPAKFDSVFTKNIADKLQGTSIPSLSSTNLSVLTVFRYDVPKFTDARLMSEKSGNLVWQAVARRFSTSLTAVAALHLYNEPRFRPLNDSHFIEEFTRSFQLLGHDLKITDKIEIDRKETVSCPGLKRLEFHDLVAREDIVSWISQQLLDAELSPASDSVGSEPAVCGGGHGFEES